MRDFLSFIFILILLFFGCDSRICSNKIIDEKVSPDSKYVASIFERDCGATTPYVRVVCLRLSNTKFDPENYDDWVFTIHGKSDVKVGWKSAEILKIFYSNTGDTPTMRSNWGAISISYK